MIFAGSISIPMTLPQLAFSLSGGGVNLDDFISTDNFSGLDFLRGPEGKQGPQGEKGEQGPQGDTGPSKDIDTITVTKTALIEVENRELSVQCPDDRKVTGGGFDFDNSDTRTIVLESKPINNGWVVVYDITARSIPSEDLVTVYAQCAKLL
jgi:hypothetical protein